MSQHNIPTFERPTQISTSKNGMQTPRSPASPLDPLASALSTAQARYTLSNPKSLKTNNEACHNFPGGNTRTVLHASPFPLAFVRGEGCELTTEDGDVYIDFLGEYSAGLYGHSNPEIASAVSDAMKSGWNFGGPHHYERELARKVRAFPVVVKSSLNGSPFRPLHDNLDDKLVRFTNSGTESNTMALAAAVAFTKRKSIIAFKNGYHGGTLSFPNQMKLTNVNLPHHFILAPYNDIKGTHAVLSSLPANSLAAIIVEPMQGNGGCVVGTKAFLQFLNTQAQKYGALFIIDEVMTSRLAYHGLSYALDLKPDLVTLGKWIGGGMTFGAFGGRKDGGVMSMFDPRAGILGHSGTFNNNVITMAAGCCGVEIYSESRVSKLNALGESMKQAIEEALDKKGIPKPQLEGDEMSEKPIESEIESLSISKRVEPTMWISGIGSLLNIHFSGESKDSLQGLFWHHMLENRIYLAQRGFITLSLEITEHHIEKFVAAIELFLTKFGDALKS